MNNPIDDTHDYVNELEQDNKRLRGLLRRCLRELIVVRDFVDIEPYELIEELKLELEND